MPWRVPVFKNNRSVYELDGGEGLVLVLELDEMHFYLGTNYELDCDSAEQAGGDEAGSGGSSSLSLPETLERCVKRPC